jgi:hypothetical protein
MGRPTIAILFAAALLAPATAHAQLSDGTVASILRECRKIADTAARVACYDNIPLGEQAAAAPPAPANASAPRGFGANQLPQTPEERAAEPEELTAAVASAVQREPGIYLITLEDGSQWQFVDPAPPSFEPPRRGATVEISSASLGSYLLRYAGQRALRARRVR